MAAPLVIRNPVWACSYTMEKELGQGAFGQAVLCETTAPERHAGNRYVVLKRVDLTKTFRGEEESKSMQNEVSVYSKLSHPNVVQYYTSFVDTEQWFNVVLEYVNGGDLHAFLAKRQSTQSYLRESQLKFLLRQLLCGLQHVQQQRVLHRDLKPQNIFITKKFEVKLGDFGLSKVLDTTDARAESAVGTPYYMAPELFDNRPYGAETDVWALGCVLYEMAALHPPFQASNNGALMHRILMGKYDPVPSRYSAELGILVADMLTADGSERPTVAELLRAPYLCTTPQGKGEEEEEEETHPCGPLFVPVVDCGVSTLGMSMVGTSRRSGSHVFMKQCRIGEDGLTEGVAAAMLEEVKAMAGLGRISPHVAPYQVVPSTPRGHFLVTSIFARHTLEDFLEGNHILRDVQVRYWVRQLISGVLALHMAGFVHGQLHPRNIILNDKKDLAVTHMLLPSTPQQVLARHASPKVGYTAPEGNSRTPPAPSGDMWSLGCVLHELYGVPVLPLMTAPTRETREGIWEAMEQNHAPETAMSLLQQLLHMEAKSRPSASDALHSGYLGHPAIPFDQGAFADLAACDITPERPVGEAALGPSPPCPSPLRPVRCPGAKRKLQSPRRSPPTSPGVIPRPVSPRVPLRPITPPSPQRVPSPTPTTAASPPSPSTHHRRGGVRSPKPRRTVSDRVIHQTPVHPLHRHASDPHIVEERHQSPPAVSPVHRPGEIAPTQAAALDRFRALLREGLQNNTDTGGSRPVMLGGVQL